jgi:integrating conjugative element protein (TIGR03752 family)
MKSSGLLKWLMIPVLLIAAFIAVRFLSGDAPPATAADGARTGTPLTTEEMKALGIEGDTPQDTLATLVAQVKQLRSELKGALDDNQRQRAENERLRQRESAIDQRIQDSLAAERDKLQAEREQSSRQQGEMRNRLQDLERRLNSLSTQSPHAELPVGLGLRDDDADVLTHDRVQWVEPEDRLPAGRSRRRATPSTESPVSDVQFPTSFAPAADSSASSEATERADGSQAKSAESTSLQPIYTVPANATLVGSVAMTALVGRVPIDGTVHDPYPFKVVIGPDNLAANGIELPDLAGAVASGTASGDWTLSCVRGEIRSLTFVFDDGTIRTLSSSSSSRNRDPASPSQGGLGWISDPYGIPCVTGERRSNAQQYLGSQTLITAAGAGAASLIKSDRGGTAVITSDGNIVGTVGLTGQEAMGRILASGVQDLSQWVNKLYGQAFAAIYVQPGARVAVHIEQPLTIDYDTQGRRVLHLSGGTHVSSDLD